MIERYTGAARFTLNNDGQWVSYEAHERRMRDLLGAVKVVVGHWKGDEITTAVLLTIDEREKIENAFYNYCAEIPGMTPEED